MKGERMKPGVNRLLRLLGVVILVGLGLLVVWQAGSTAVSSAAQPAAPFETLALPAEALNAPLDLAAAPPVAHPKLDAALSALLRATAAGPDQTRAALESQALRQSGERVQVQAVVRAADLTPAVQAINAAGGEVTGVANGDTLIQAWLPPGALAALVDDPAIGYLRRPAELTLLETAVGSAASEGLAALNAGAWQAAGVTGRGVKVGVIDGGFLGYNGLLGSDLPANVTVRNFVDGEGAAQVDGTTPHGTACAEIIHDIAPDAELYLVKIATNVDLAEAVDYLIAQNVDVISTSLGWYNLTPGDGTGEFADLARRARDNGIVWATAAGNDRESHWGGAFNDSDGNGYHNFAGSQEVNFFGPGNGQAYAIPAGYLMRVFARWDDWSSVTQDYDLYLVRWDGSAWRGVASSTAPQNGGFGQTPAEYAQVVTSGGSTAYGFVVQRRSSGRNVNLEIFAPRLVELDKRVAARSLANLADAPDAITVAALDVNAPYPQESYSAEGPTNGPGGVVNDGIIKPDLAGYANVSTSSYGARAFNGTSAATPHVAGAAALVLSAFPAYTPAQAQTFLYERAVDVGSAGRDAQFGYGRVTLGQPPAGVTPTPGPSPTPTPTGKSIFNFLPVVPKAQPPTATPTPTVTLSPAETPTATPTGGAFTPQPGVYSGANPPITFEVTQAQEVCSLEMTAPFGAGTCRIYATTCIPIRDNRFQLGAIGLSVSGAFDAATHAVGDYWIVFCGDQVALPASEGTWQAGR
jgi:subtilisin family serine protease